MAKYKVGDKVWIAHTDDCYSYQPRLAEVTEVMAPASNGEIVYEVVLKLDREFYNTCYTGRGESKIYETEEDAQKAAQEEMRLKEKAQLTEAVFDSFSKGNIVFITEEGFYQSAIEDFIKQPLEGMLYDLNRNEAVIRTEANEDKGWRWVHDLSMVKLLEYYYNKVKEYENNTESNS